MTVCQVKLSNGLLIHGPQCHSENEAKEKAALFALQQLGSLGTNFPLPSPVFARRKHIRKLGKGRVWFQALQQLETHLTKSRGRVQLKSLPENGFSHLQCGHC